LRKLLPPYLLPPMLLLLLLLLPIHPVCQTPMLLQMRRAR
jgi:hypothetical protein